MISRITGQVSFDDDLQIEAHMKLSASHIRNAHEFMVPGWRGCHLGIHRSDRGEFETTAIVDSECRVQLVLLSHFHSFYRSDTPADAERRTFHEGVIRADLGGQREFSWGRMYCRFDPATNKDLLIVAYAPGPHVPMSAHPLPSFLEEHEPEPADALGRSNDLPRQ